MNSEIKRKNMDSLAEYRDGLYKKPRLKYLFFELTDSCNLACIHCGSKSSPYRKTFLSMDSIRRVLDSVATHYNANNIMVCLTGGEPLLHPDFFRIASYVASRGFPCGITTNGTLIDCFVAEKIKASGISSVSVSLDGIEEAHDRFRNFEGAYQNTIKGIRNLTRVANGNILIQITTVVHKKNIGRLNAIFEIVRSLEVDSWRLINLEPMGRALEHKELLLDGADFKSLLNYIRLLRYDSKVPVEVTYGCSHYVTGEYEHEIRDNYFICGSGIYVGSVLCNGDIYSCLDIERRRELVQGNVSKDDFITVWENEFDAFRQDRSALCADCLECGSRRYCKGDSAHTWDYNNNRLMICLKNVLGLNS